MEKVSVVKCSSYKNKEVRKAIEESLKNINFKFKNNMKVLIKPNLLAAFKPEKAITTHPIILEELCKILKKYNAKIYIGESSAFDTDRVIQVSGIGRLSKYAEIINFENQEKVFFNFNIYKFPLPKILFNMDLIINVAKLKTHGLTGVTLCVKNLFGCIPGRVKENFHRTLPYVKDFSMLLLRIHEIVKPELNIIDGVIGLEGNGPGSSGTVKKAELIFAGKNASAVDILASEKMGFKPFLVYTNIFSGVKRKDIEIVGSAKDAFIKFKKPSSYFVPFFGFLVKLLPKPKIYFDTSKCVKCGLCSKKCPMKAIELKPFPECNHKDCIKCLCCIEVCPQNAILLRDSLLIRILRKTVSKIKSFCKK